MHALKLALTSIVMTVPAVAQDLPTGREAQRMIFAPRGQAEGVVIPHESLNPAETALLGSAVQEGLLPEMLYYGALAIAPDAGLASGATTTAVGNFHNEEAARAAALARCDAARADVGDGCVVVLIVRPTGWDPDAPLQLSASATAVLRGDYRSMSRPKAMAISPATGAWGIGETATGATDACGQPDCEVVVRD